MKRIVIGIVLVIAGTTVGLIRPVNALSTTTHDNELTGSSSQSNTDVVVQCGPGQAVSGDLGYTGTACHGCTISGKHLVGEPDMEFEAEPVLSGIRKDGPAAGRLMEGDVLVAIDGQAITTREAAVHLSWLKPNEPVRLTVRRNGILTDVEINPALRCRTVTQPHVFTFIDRRSLSQRSSEPIRPNPPGWIGVALGCGTCGPLLEWQSRTTVLTFPVVVRVLPDSPAEQAGLAEGDVLLAIDGKSLKTQAGASALHNVRPNQRLTILLLRDTQTITVTLTASSLR
jgi:S1-C subfamily serine protease